MMPQPETRANRQNCDTLRPCPTPRGDAPFDFAGWSAYPSLAAGKILFDHLPLAFVHTAAAVKSGQHQNQHDAPEHERFKVPWAA
jgi:hypothetical protein